MKYITILLLTVLSFATVNAEDLANEHGWFVGGKLGNLNAEIEHSNAVLVDENVFFGGVYGGYKLNKNFALDAEYMVAPSVKSNFEDSDTIIGHFAVAPRLSLPLSGSFSLYGRVGMAVIVYYEEFDGGRIEFDETWGGVGLLLGLGAEFSMTQHLRLMLGYDYVDANLDEEDGNTLFDDLDYQAQNFTLGIHYQF